MWKVLKAVDLTLPLNNNTRVYPGDPEPLIKPAATIAADGYNLHSVCLSTQMGTHVDAPYHFLPEGQKVEDLTLQLFAGNGVIVDVRHKGAGEEITVTDLAGVEPLLRPDAAVLFNTNWNEREGQEYLNHPYLSPVACRYLLGKGILTFGIDAINIDPMEGNEYPVHRLIAEKGGIIVENLTNLDQVDFEHPFVTFFPLKLVGCDGSPVRAVAMQLQPQGYDEADSSLTG